MTPRFWPQSRTHLLEEHKLAQELTHFSAALLSFAVSEAADWWTAWREEGGRMQCEEWWLQASACKAMQTTFIPQN